VLPHGQPGSATSGDLTAATVTWRNFRSAHRGWDLSALGTLVFDRKQYEQALQATMTA